MIQVMVTYTVKPERVAQNEELVRAVYAGLREIGDPGIHYATFKLQDGKTFVHLALLDSEEKQAVLAGSPAFKAFQAELKDRCEVPPKPQTLTEVGSYQLPK